MWFSYAIDDAEWATARLESGTAKAAITASYICEPLGDLLGALAKLLEGEPVAFCTWEEEPGAFRWSFRRDCAGDTVVREAENILRGRGDKGYRKVWGSPFPVDDLDAVRRGLASAGDGR